MVVVVRGYHDGRRGDLSNGREYHWLLCTQPRGAIGAEDGLLNLLKFEVLSLNDLLNVCKREEQWVMGSFEMYTVVIPLPNSHL